MGAELAEAVLEVLTEQTLTLNQLVDKIREDPRFRRADLRAVRAQLQKLEETYQIIRERDGATIRFRWFSPRDAQVIAERNERQRRLRTSQVQMLIREGLGVALRTESIALVRLVPSGGILPLVGEEAERAQMSIAVTIASCLEAQLGLFPRRT